MICYILFILYIIWTVIRGCCCLFYFSLFHSLCLLLLYVLFSVRYFFLIHCIFLRSWIFTIVLLIIGRQLVELCVFLVTCHHMIYICNLMWKYGKINWWWWFRLQHPFSLSCVELGALITPFVHSQGYTLQTEKNPRLCQTKLQEICRTNAHLLIQILHEHLQYE